MSRRQQLIDISNAAASLRIAIAAWATTASDKAREALGEHLTPLRYDLDELATGNYDPANPQAGRPSTPAPSSAKTPARSAQAHRKRVPPLLP